MKKMVSWFGVTGLIAAAGLLILSGAAPLQAAEGWCCKDGVVQAATPEMCKEKGGVWFATMAEAERYCKEPPTGWCCKDGVVFAATAEECKAKGGAYFATMAEAERYCKEPPTGWCCKDGVVFAATAEECKAKGGAYFATMAEAERYCKEPPTGWCCKDGFVFAASPGECKEKGGVYFPSQADAERFCKQTPPRGWCCRDGVVFAATAEECKAKGGVYFATRADAERYCQKPPTGWCCRDGVVFPATAEECKAKGGVYFATKLEAEKYCQDKNKLPDLVIRDIVLNRKCQVVVIVGNAGPGMVPDEVWTVHKPTSSSVYLYVNGRKWGGGTIWGFDPGRLLQGPGGTARYVSSLIVGAETEITALVDHTGEVSETDETNNKMVKKLKCLAAESRLNR